jgi:hypothetical protein
MNLPKKPGPRVWDCTRRGSLFMREVLKHAALRQAEWRNSIRSSMEGCSYYWILNVTQCHMRERDIVQRNSHHVEPLAATFSLQAKHSGKYFLSQVVPSLDASLRASRDLQLRSIHQRIAFYGSPVCCRYYLGGDPIMRSCSG